MARRTRDWVVDVVVGGGTGFVLGGIAAVNAIIFLGTEDGYEATLPELFRERPLAAVLAVAFQIAGPIIGVILARRLRADRRRPPTS